MSDTWWKLANIVRGKLNPKHISTNSFTMIERLDTNNLDKIRDLHNSNMLLHSLLYPGVG